MVMERITGALGGLLGGGQKQQAQAQLGYPSMLTLIDGDAAFDTAAEVIALLAAAGASSRIWEFTVPAQQMVRWGFGSPLAPANQGYLWFAILDTNVDFCQGVVSLGYENHSGHVYIPIADIDDNSLHTATVTTINTARIIDKNQMQALPEGGSQGKPEFVGQDSRLVIDYAVKVRATAEDNADFNIPVTIYG